MIIANSVFGFPPVNINVNHYNTNIQVVHFMCINKMFKHHCVAPSKYKKTMAV